MAKLEITIPNWLDKICVWPVLYYRKRRFGYTFRKIDLGEGISTIVDPDIYYLIGHLKWTACGDDGNIYAARILRKTVSGRIKTVYLHREITDPPKGVLVDHKNRNKLDNRVENLRFATHSQNTHNCEKRKITASKYVGIWRDKDRNKWAARIVHKGEKTWLGRFDSEIEAAKAYDRAAKKYFGEFARLNFPMES